MAGALVFEPAALQAAVAAVIAGFGSGPAECDEVANLCAYLASPLAHFVNGTMIEIDGGQQKALMDRLRDR